MSGFDSLAFRSALGIFATGVTIVTTRDAFGKPVGLTANSFNSVSLDPPLVLWSLSKKSNSLTAFKQAEYFAVHLLAVNQQHLSERFAARGTDKFEGMSIEEGLGGIPLIANCAVRFQCRTSLQYDGGDHVIFVGDVQEFDKVDVPPLVYYGGSYAVATRSPQAAPWQTVHTQRKGGFSEDSLHYLIGLLDLQLTHHIAPVIRDLGFQEPRELQLLMILGLGENRTLAEVNSLVPTLEPHFADAIPASLKTLGFIRISADGRLSITDQGRQRLVLGTVAAKSKEADALGALDEAERLALRHMLKRLIVSTDVN